MSSSIPIKVFISYTHDSEEHLNYIFEMSNKLRSEGIDIILDQYEASPSQGWPRWMEHKINEADFVIMVCTKKYYERLNDKDQQVGLGIKWEGKLIYQHLYNNTVSKKFIPVLLKKEDKEFIPLPVQCYTYYVITDPNDYDKLYWYLRGVNVKEKPPLGKLRPLPKKEKKSIFVTDFINVKLWDQAQWKAVGYINNSITEPPTLLFLFEEKEPAKKIIKDWLNRLGKFDKFNELRISIIEGEIPGQLSGYSVHVGSNVQNIIKRAQNEGIILSVDTFIVISRVHRMNPPSNSNNLRDFKKLYERFGSYFIKMGVYEEGNIYIIEGLYLLKKDIEFRNVNDIVFDNDLDTVIFKK